MIQNSRFSIVFLYALAATAPTLEDMSNYVSLFAHISDSLYPRGSTFTHHLFGTSTQVRALF